MEQRTECGPIPDGDLYKLEFKYYKSKQRPPDLSSVIDANKESAFSWSTCAIGRNDHGVEETLKVGELTSVPGLLFVPAAFSPEGLHRLTHSCLYDYPERPNVTNLEVLPASTTKRLGSVKVALDDELRKKLRWATLGYHHDWNTKVYNMEHFSRFPFELAQCAAVFAEKVARYEYQYRAEAAIVNYYPIGMTLAGHVDQSEEDQTAPLVSISLGCTCIFLIGGSSRAVRPSALFLRHGDVVIMTGPARQAYHGVPRVFIEKGSDRPDAYALAGDCEESICKKYLSKHRININIRQVHKPDV
ncbi:alpha-ketoglutarate-dependent dioxygenase abh1 [Galendromus occidentalis]|uniref:Alpha-ketoglutarate-dependent dioxygenase abh1 n=1 Tax=Galendromus occidentalis TaxID=34638 RepID=A0AAJ6QXN8_9ACAR|nr:alpha-ketoglutarate-dependent dioxygenase abh1 [Galendromus occidentalis]